MIEAIAGVCRWMVTICSAVIIGTTLFRYFCLRDLGRDKDHRETRSERILLLVSAVLLFLFHVGSLAGQYGALGDRALTLDGWVQFIFGTHAGRVWIWRAAVAILVVPTAFLARFDSPRHTIAICLLVILIVLYIGLGS
jgi:putative copper export protein